MKLPVPKNMTIGLVDSYGFACDGGRNYFKDTFGGRAACDLKTLDRVLREQPGCITWLLENIARRWRYNPGLSDVASAFLGDLSQLHDAVYSEAVQVRRLIRAVTAPVPTAVDEAIHMYVCLWHADRIRGLAVKYFDIPDTAEGGER